MSSFADFSGTLSPVFSKRPNGSPFTTNTLSSSMMPCVAAPLLSNLHHFMGFLLSSTFLIGACAGFLHYFSPLGVLGAHEARELRRRGAVRLRPEVLHEALHVRA